MFPYINYDNYVYKTFGNVIVKAVVGLFITNHEISKIMVRLPQEGF